MKKDKCDRLVIIKTKNESISMVFDKEISEKDLVYMLNNYAYFNNIDTKKIDINSYGIPNNKITLKDIKRFKEIHKKYGIKEKDIMSIGIKRIK